GFPGLVQHAHRPNEYLAYAWRSSGTMTPEAVKQPANLAQVGFQVALTHVALADRMSVPLGASTMGSVDNPVDNRTLARMVLFPSGELPREVQKGQLGGEAVAAKSARRSSGGSGGVPQATV